VRQGARSHHVVRIHTEIAACAPDVVGGQVIVEISCSSSSSYHGQVYVSFPQMTS